MHLLVIETFAIGVLSELVSHAGEVAGVDFEGVVVEQLEHLDVLAGPSSSTLPVIMARNSAKSVPLPLPSMSDHLLELLVLDLEAEGAHGSLELTYVNLSIDQEPGQPAAPASAPASLGPPCLILHKLNRWTKL